MAKKKKNKAKNIIIVSGIALILLLGAYFLLPKLISNFQKSSVPETYSILLDRGLLKEADKYLPDYDYIVSSDDLMFIWVKPEMAKIIGYTSEELSNLRNIDLISEDYEKNLAYSRIMNRMVSEEGEFESVIKTKDGLNLKVKMFFKTFVYKEGHYLVGYVEDYEFVSDEEAKKYYSPE